MVDIETHRRFYKLSKIENIAIEHVEEYLPSKVIESDSPPTGSFTLLLPPITYGFGFHDKKWRWYLQIWLTLGYADNDFVGKLAIEYATDVVWDGDMLNKVIGLDGTKDILRNLIFEHKAFKNILAGQGLGQVILLHSGPESGKTLAVKALAESAGKPLYQLVPYEIGIEPNQVENNIKEAFYLGGIWDAVMALNDCDMFIGEEREHTLAGSSIASIIVQALKNYPGIAVLTMTNEG